MLKEQHMRKVEEALNEAIAAARVAGLSNRELKETFDMLIKMSEI